MKRKTIALLLALVMCLGLSVPAFAEDPWTKSKDGIDITVNYGDSGGRTATYSITGEGTFTEAHAELVIVLTDETGGVPEAVTIYFGPGITVTDQVKGELAEMLRTRCDTDTVTFNSTPAVETAPAAETVGGFTDVKTGDYFADPVLWAVDKKIASGTATTIFSPNENCTIAQILTFLWRANGSPETAGSNPFSDVKDSDYYYGAALWAYEKGMVSGETFGGSRPCTRSMAVTYMWKAAGSPATSGSKFTDVPAGADYAQAVNWAVEKGVAAGTADTSFSPDSVCTRGQIVTFLYRWLAG